MATRGPSLRRQLSLYVPGAAAAEIEAVRRVLDPVQSGLIPAHVTLCREEEFVRMSDAELLRRLAHRRHGPVSLQFGRPQEFSSHGILIPCIGGQAGFKELRAELLGDQASDTLKPHLTLAHPRNPKAPGNSLANAARLPEFLSIDFPTVFLIQQVETQPWKVLREFNLSRDVDGRS